MAADWWTDLWRGRKGKVDPQIKAMRARLGALAGQEHPGMGGAEFQRALGGIYESAQREKAGAAQMLSRFGGSMDPNAFARMSSNIQAGIPGAIGGLEAQRSALDRQTLMNIAPIMAQLSQIRGQQRQRQGGIGEPLAGLAGLWLGGKMFGAGAGMGGLGGMSTAAVPETGMNTANIFGQTGWGPYRQGGLPL